MFIIGVNDLYGCSSSMFCWFRLVKMLLDFFNCLGIEGVNGWNCRCGKFVLLVMLNSCDRFIVLFILYSLGVVRLNCLSR